MSTTNKSKIAQEMLGIFSRKPEDVKMVDDTNSGGGNFFNPDSKSAPNQTYRAVIKFLPKLYGFENENKTETVETVSYWIPEGASGGFRYLSPKSLGKKENCFVADQYWAWKESKDAQLEKLAKKLSYSRNTYALIQVIKDYVNPDNDGKIFFYNVPFAIQKQIKSTMYPSQEDIEQGIVTEANDVFNPITGLPMVLKIPIKNTDAGEYRDYDECKFNEKLPTMILLPGEKTQMKNSDIPTDGDGLTKLQEQVLETILEGPSLKDLEYVPMTEEQNKRAKNALEIMSSGKVIDEPVNESKPSQKEEPKETKTEETKTEETKSEVSQSVKDEQDDLLKDILGDQE